MVQIIVGIIVMSDKASRIIKQLVIRGHWTLVSSYHVTSQQRRGGGQLAPQRTQVSRYHTHILTRAFRQQEN